MERQLLLDRVHDLRNEGMSIRVIASELGVHPSRVQRALKSLDRTTARKKVPPSGAADFPNKPKASRFVGRQAEMGALKTALTDVLLGHGRLVMLVGEPGIGKTRAAQEIGAFAEARGVSVLWGRCHESQGAPPYWPWVQIVRSYVTGTPPDRIRSEMGASASDIAEIVTDIKRQMPDLQPSPLIDDPEQARFRLFDSITRFLKTVSLSTPLLLILEDLHRADRPSMLLLAFLAREMAESRLLVLGTYSESEISPEHDLSSTLGEVVREPLFQQIRLKGLSEDEVESFVHGAAQTKPLADLAKTVYAKTEGNPFFMTEVVRLLAQDGALGSISSFPEPDVSRDGLIVGIPDSVRLAIGLRVARLSPECHRTLTVASVIGREFGLDELGCLMDGEIGVELLGAVEEGISARMIEEMPATVGRYQFAHVLIQETLSGELSSVRRAELHARIGEVLEALYSENIEIHVDELAYHFLQGSVIGKAADYALKAGDKASDVYAWEQAIAQYETAAELLEKLEMEPRQQAEVLEKLILALGMLKGRDFLDHTEKASSIYEALGDGLKAGAVHLQASLLWRAGDWEIAHAHAMQAILLLEPEGESEQLAAAYCRAGDVAAHLNGPAPGAIALIERGRDMAQRLGNADEFTLAVTRLAHMLVYHVGELERGLELHNEAWETAKSTNDAAARANVAAALSLAHMSLRDVDNAIQWVKESMEANDRAGKMHSKMVNALVLAQASALSGNVSQALQSLEMARQLARKTGIEIYNVPGPMIVAQPLLDFHLGDWDRAEEGLLECLESGRRNHIPAVTQEANSALGRLHLEEGEFESARMYFLEAATASEVRGEKTLEIAPRAALAQVALAEGEVDEARAHLNRAQEILLNGQDWRGLAAEVKLSEAALATYEERWEYAAAAFHEASEINRRYGLPYYEARSLTEWGRMCLSRNDRGDRQQAEDLFNQALDIFQRIQARKMVQKVVALKDQIETMPVNAHTYPDRLTQREVEVLLLIAGGNSNREIAKVLYLSVRTIERHITNIYVKINARGKADATAYALNRDLLDLST